ncbi:hypothetical protein STRPS_0807 [Streptococcus pseudoporcinus LQ 940-04]|uniref:Uncharacterized protein n=1 Tax=Streptococcus pseudoporcinus LQ 940-04 TaxID=875093 RepID=G5K9Y7_9STRE|nr:hypothetical protein HMPREF9320_1190 [Streptococcus pseudoporcinus SPIN 20026]EHI64781.1 hypothetical protein STRPS_0807 [Streptococcus pseudoporcinus LQ 940-04]
MEQEAEKQALENSPCKLPSYQPKAKLEKGFAFLDFKCQKIVFQPLKL